MVATLMGALVCIAVVCWLALDWWRHPKAVEEWRTHRQEPG